MRIAASRDDRPRRRNFWKESSTASERRMWPLAPTEQIEAANIAQRPPKSKQRRGPLPLRRGLVAGFRLTGDVESARDRRSGHSPQAEPRATPWPRMLRISVAWTESRFAPDLGAMLAHISWRRISAGPSRMDHQDRRNFIILGAMFAFVLVGWLVVSALQRQAQDRRLPAVASSELRGVCGREIVPDREPPRSAAASRDCAREMRGRSIRMACCGS